VRTLWRKDEVAMLMGEDPVCTYRMAEKLTAILEGSKRCDMAQLVARRAAVRRFESRLGTPVEALFLSG
jgi:hypothetical protein